MTWTPPPPEPVSVQWIRTADHNTITPHHFLIVCNDWIAWQRLIGVKGDIPEPSEWFDANSDLQNLSTVVSWWPKTSLPHNLQAPRLIEFVSLLKPLGAGAVRQTFAQHLAWRTERVKAHIRANGGDMENPNETKEERSARKNRERQARYKLKHAPGSDDPDEHALIEVMKLEANKLSEWRAYLRKYVKDQKLVCDSAVRAAKQQRDDNVSAAQQAIVDQELRVLAAKEALDNYKI